MKKSSAVVGTVAGVLAFLCLSLAFDGGPGRPELRAAEPEKI